MSFGMSFGSVSDSIGFIRFDAGFIRIEIRKDLLIEKNSNGFKNLSGQGSNTIGLTVRIEMLVQLGFEFIRIETCARIHSNRKHGLKSFFGLILDSFGLNLEFTHRLKRIENFRLFRSE